MHVGAIEATVDLRQLVVHIADVEVAPLRVPVVVADAREELALRRRHLLHRAVVAEGRVVVVGIDAPEQRLRRLVHEVAEELVERAFARIGARGQLPVVAELAVHEEREPPVGIRIDILLRIFTLQQVDRPARTAARQRQVRHPDVEPVVGLQLEIAKIELSAPLLVEQGYFDRMRAVRHDFFRDEAAIRAQGHRMSRDVNVLARRQSGTAHADGSAAEPDVVQGQRIVAIGRE